MTTLRMMSGAVAFAALLLQAHAAYAAQQWVKDEATLDGEARIDLGTDFTKIKGKFRATPESMLDAKDSINGTFLVGQYRHVYKRPVAGASGKLVDEMVSTEILDCEGKFYGTMKQQWLRNGKPVAETKTPLSDISMVQTRGANMGSKLCDVYQRRPVAGLERRAVSNPSYKPQPTANDVDALIDKYSAPKKGIDK